ncbi:hypothetical protein T439DRAFT_96284 [Meredithblackwellia eburnea MCA 4105]
MHLGRRILFAFLVMSALFALVLSSPLHAALDERAQPAESTDPTATAGVASSTDSSMTTSMANSSSTAKGTSSALASSSGAMASATTAKSGAGRMSALVGSDGSRVFNVGFVLVGIAGVVIVLA